MCSRSGERVMGERVTAAWKLQEIAGLLVNRTIGLRTRVYEACVRSALLYRADT